jgi:hypothetical protein
MHGCWRVGGHGAHSAIFKFAKRGDLEALDVRDTNLYISDTDTIRALSYCQNLRELCAPELLCAPAHDTALHVRNLKRATLRAIVMPP